MSHNSVCPQCHSADVKKELYLWQYFLLIPMPWSLLTECVYAIGPEKTIRCQDCGSEYDRGFVLYSKISIYSDIPKIVFYLYIALFLLTILLIPTFPELFGKPT